ncbi:hypothetical protein [Natroniella sp. ANB-PHB2]|uniref:hypothetical protein n=1 Tax=Natroniella sp. ANB-PHB2 TaxID=3384444 RepID=UPI0038D369AF
MKIKASRIFSDGFGLTNIFFPDTLEILPTKVKLKKRKLLGLKSTEKNVLRNQIASVRRENGFFFSTIIVETTGGAVSDLEIKWVNKRKAKKAVEEIESMILNI